jgi:outer membrane protein OmpA-like peptidoglycan-associated protein
MKKIMSFAFALSLAGVLHADVVSSDTAKSGSAPLYNVNIKAGSTKVINYRHLSGSTKIDFRGTPLSPSSKGEATVKSISGLVRIDAHFENLDPASKFGPEYLTYVLWSISPEGRVTNLGELVLDSKGRSSIRATSQLQAFGLIVTAEPYYAVTQLGNVVVLENAVRKDTKGKVEEMTANYDLLQRGQYRLNMSPADLQPMKMDKKTPFYLYQARNAVKIAKAAGADKMAADTYQKAATQLRAAEDDMLKRKNKKQVAGEAREAIQTAEDARLITIKRSAEEDVNNKLTNAQVAVSSAEAARLMAMSDAEKAHMTAAQAAQQTALAQQQAAMSAQEAEKAKSQVAQSEQEKAQLRSQLRDQLNAVLETRDTARGLIVNMSDVLFSTGKYDLKPPVREKLAKIAGIVASHPGLKLAVEGHTDNVGSDAFNQTLSEKRAGAVRDYLVSQGIAQDAVTATGFGKTKPVASNDTSAGRQKNRRVEIVVSGEGIGTNAQAQ